MDCNYWFETANVSCFKNGIEVVKDLNLKLKYSENVILLGPNGSGKSSIIELINRNIYPIVRNESTLKIFDKELIDLWELRKRISTVNSEIKNRINPNLKLLDLVISGLHGKFCYVSNKSQRDIAIAEKIINTMHLNKLSHKAYSFMSDGERQIALIARALVNNPEILILDEPIANLDYRSKFYVIDKINELTNLNTKVFCVTHDISMITNVYNRIVMLKDRSIFAEGTQREVMTSENINQLFDIKIQVTEENGSWHIKRYLDNNYQ